MKVSKAWRGRADYMVTDLDVGAEAEEETHVTKIFQISWQVD